MSGKWGTNPSRHCNGRAADSEPVFSVYRQQETNGYEQRANRGSVSGPTELSDQRLDQAVATLMPEHSRSRIQNWVKSGELTVNGRARKPRDKVLVDDEIVIAADVTAEVSLGA